MKSYVIMALGSNREFNRLGNLLMIYGALKRMRKGVGVMPLPTV